MQRNHSFPKIYSLLFYVLRLTLNRQYDTIEETKKLKKVSGFPHQFTKSQVAAVQICAAAIWMIRPSTTKRRSSLREKIIDAAIEAFTENGLKFTMNDLAKKLGISKKTIYTIFESKQDVLLGIGDRYAADFNQMQRELETDDSLGIAEKLEKLLLALPDNYHGIGLSRIYELAEKYPKPYRHLMNVVNQGWTLAEMYLKKGMEEGKFRQIYIPVVMAMIEGTVSRFLESDILYKNHLTYEQGKKEMVSILMKGIQTE